MERDIFAELTKLKKEMVISLMELVRFRPSAQNQEEKARGKRANL